MASSFHSLSHDHHPITKSFSFKHGLSFISHVFDSGVFTIAFTTKYLNQGFILATILLVRTKWTYALSPGEFNVTVAGDGTGDYITIKEAISAAPNNNKFRYTIYIKNGTYNENVRIPKTKPNMALIGDGATNTIITSNLSVKMGLNNMQSATLGVFADNFTLKYITVENSAGPAGGQAVAMATVSNHSVYYKSVFLGNQDTLYTRSGYQFYRDCDVYGTVDFIYGAAVAVFQNCNLYARTANRYAVFTAQGRDSIQQYSGYTIQNCTLTVSPEPIHSGKTGLIGFMGRPWRNYSTVIVMESWIDDFIDRRGWSEMGDNSVDSLTYREYNNRGPGSNTDRRVKWAGYGVLRSDWEAKPYTADVVIHGDSWIPGMGIPYYGGLISG